MAGQQRGSHGRVSGGITPVSLDIRQPGPVVSPPPPAVALQCNRDRSHRKRISPLRALAFSLLAVALSLAAQTPSPHKIPLPRPRSRSRTTSPSVPRTPWSTLCITWPRRRRWHPASRRQCRQLRRRGRLALAVVYPFACNLGGGGFMLIDQHTGKDIFIDYREMLRLPRPPTCISTTPATSSPTPAGRHSCHRRPGSVAGLVHAEKKMAASPSPSHAPAIRLATDGIVLTDEEAVSLHDKILTASSFRAHLPA